MASKWVSGLTRHFSGSRVVEEGVSDGRSPQHLQSKTWLDEKKRRSGSGFQMPLHYPSYKKADYEKMEEWKVDLLLHQYGLSSEGTIHEKRVYAMGTFLWPDQY